MTKTQRSNAWAMIYLATITPAYVLLHPRETLSNWRNGRARAPQGGRES